MSAAERLRELPDDALVYVPRVGEVTVREIVQARTEESPALDGPWGETIRMWQFIALNPTARPWENSGPIAPAPVESHGSESTSAAREDPCR